MTAPIIGITTYRTPHKGGFLLNSLAEAYVKAVSLAGGIPVLIPLLIQDEHLQSMLTRLDGILFSGGGDIDPVLFGGEEHPEVNFIDADRDRIEIQLVKIAVQTSTPIFGICRGIQSINVALGGTLYTHIPDQLNSDLHPRYVEGADRSSLIHEVNIESGTIISRILESTVVQVNSLHHQGISKLAPGLVAAGHAPDGLIEAVEMPEHLFCIAVQWHPEWLVAHKPMRALFEAFVEASSK